MKILLIEDDVFISSFLKAELYSKSHIVDTIDNGTDGSYHARTNKYDAIILDYSLPGKDGISVCKDIRSAGNTTPIIFLSATSEDKIKVSALDTGADDYMEKPFSMDELHSRLKAISRRQPVIQKQTMQFGDFIIDKDAQSIFKKDKKIRLTRKEFAVVEFLAIHAGKPKSRSEIMDHVWSAEIDPFSNTVEAHIRTIRLKIGNRDKHPFIRNISGRGYTISP